MKKIYVMFLMAAIYPFVGRSQDFGNLQISELALVGISDAYAGVKRYCKKTTGPELSNLNAYIIANNGKLTTQGLVSACQSYLLQTEDSCREDELVIDKAIPASVQCQAYIGTALDTHNKLVDKLKNPGTYIQLYHGTGQLGNHRGVYSIVGVVPGNLNDIYEITASGEVKILPFKTGTPNMFINIDTNDNVIGVHNHSVIYTQLDMTKAVSDMIEQNTGSLYVVNSYNLSSHGDLDIKDSIGVELYQTSEQKNDTIYGAAFAHTNGVFFEGSIVNFEWLGHYIFGARKGRSGKGVGGLYDVMADNEQKSTSGQTSGQGQTDSEFHKGVAEQARVRYAGETRTEYSWNPNADFATNSQEMGRAYFLSHQKITVFEDDEINTEPEAYRIAGEYTKKILRNASYVKCWGVCGSSGDDTVTCTWRTNSGESGTTDFIFDDICDGTSSYKVLDKVRDFSSVQTRTEYEATSKAEQHIRSKNTGVTDLVCDASCDLMGDDTVYCFFKKGGTQYKQEFVFDDICN